MPITYPGTPLTPNATDRLYCGCLPRSAKYIANECPGEHSANDRLLLLTSLSYEDYELLSSGEDDAR